MRLNARELAHYARHSTRVDKQGWLEKRGAFNPAFRRRWFCLKGNLLFYYRTPSKHMALGLQHVTRVDVMEEDPIGLIILSGCRPESSHRFSAHPNFPFKLKFDFGDDGMREYELVADSGALVATWSRTPQAAGGSGGLVVSYFLFSACCSDVVVLWLLSCYN